MAQNGFINIKEELLKREKVVQLFSLEIYSKTIVLMAGESTVGKTVSCLHLANEAVKNDKLVIYIDTDDHPILNRPEPNLLREFMTQNPNKYEEFFKYTNDFSEDKILKMIEEMQPTLLIIDSIYVPFAKRYPDAPMSRAKDIRKFLMNIRDKILKAKTSIVITSQIGKKEKDNSDLLVYNILGGEGLKHFSDTKWFINFIDKGTDDMNLGKRIISVDRQQKVQMLIDYGGIIKSIK